MPGVRTVGLVGCALLVLLFTCFRRVAEQPNKCEMTFMYRYMFFMPIFVNTSVPLDSDGDATRDYRFSTDFRHYSTVLYGEGAYADEYRSTKKVSGIPVVFVPGNAGSAHQVRSLGSLLLNKTESKRAPFRFDTFAVDFNEELTGFAGMYLERQIRYLQLAVQHIWGMYKRSPHGIVLVGHSMGGVVIRSLLRSPSFDPSTIAFVITFATPHSAPPVLFDNFMEEVYETMHRKWAERAGDIPIISISGGMKDVLVAEHLAREPAVSHFSTSSIHGVELETDHLCIVWCNQLVRQTSRVLFDYASSPETFRDRANEVLSRFYASNDNAYTKPNEVRRREEKVQIDSHIQYLKNKENSSVEFELSVRSKEDGLFVLFSGGRSWVFVDGSPFPSVRSFRRVQYALLTRELLFKRISSLLAPQHSMKAIAVPQTQQISINFDSFAFFRGLFSKVWEAELDGKSLAKVVSVQFGTLWFAVKATLSTVACTDKIRGVSRIDFMSGGLRRFSEVDDGSDSVVGFLLDGSQMNASLLFLLDTRCTYRASVSLAYAESFRLVVKRYVGIIPGCLMEYVMSALVAAIFLKSDLVHSSHSVLQLTTTIVAYVLFIGFLQLFDIILLSISTLLIASVFWILQIFSSFVVQVSLKVISKWTNFRFSIGSHLVVGVALVLNYLLNGFLALSLLLPLNLYVTLKSSTSEAAKRCEGCSLLSLLALVHALSLTFFSPFGICSVWNFMRYDAAAVREDPARLSAYVLGISMLLRSALRRYHFPAMRFVPALVLALLASPQMFHCVSRLGFLLVVVAASYPFVFSFSLSNSHTVQSE